MLVSFNETTDIKTKQNKQDIFCSLFESLVQIILHAHAKQQQQQQQTNKQTNKDKKLNRGIKFNHTIYMIIRTDRSP